MVYNGILTCDEICRILSNFVEIEGRENSEINWYS
jgi:hypothetical protein